LGGGGGKKTKRPLQRERALAKDAGILGSDILGGYFYMGQAIGLTQEVKWGSGRLPTTQVQFLKRNGKSPLINSLHPSENPFKSY